MGYTERIHLYERLEALRDRPLICYVTSSRQNADGQMGSDVIPELTQQIIAIPHEKTAVDVLIVSNGGDPTVSWRFITMLRERFDQIGVLIPFAAYSAATLLALGADEILMHPFSNLGPVDPQLHTIRKLGTEQEMFSFGSEDLRHFMDFLRKDVGLSDQEQLQRSFELVCKDIGAIQIGVAKRSSYLALSMGEKLLMLHMDDKNRAKAIAEALNTSFYHHGYPLGRKEATEIGLPVTNGSKEIEAVMWDIWQDFETEMQCNKPFIPLEVFLSDPARAQIIGGPIPQVALPANLPPPIMQQAYQQILQQVGVQMVEPLEYSLLQAALESNRCRSVFTNCLKISAVRQPDLKVAVSIVPVRQGWERNC